MSEIAKLKERIAELEKRVAELEAQPRESHTHFHSYPPIYQQPYPLTPPPNVPWKVTIGDPIPFLTTTAGGNYNQ